MSIYATLWTLRFPRDGDDTFDCDWIAVRAQAVLPHIGTPTSGHGYEGGDPYADFLPPPVPVDEQGTAPFNRAVVFVTEHSTKGTERHRPFLRCLSGLGLCLWRLNRFQEAERVFNRMLWLNPEDNQNARLCIAEVQAEKPWQHASTDRRIK